jgi:hypothetical protein
MISRWALAAAAATWGLASLVTAPAATAATYVAPSHTAVVQLMVRAEEYTTGSAGATGEHLHQDGPAVVVPDGKGGWITAIPAVRWPTADGYGQYILFWHNQTFVGTDAVGTSSLATGTDLGNEAVQLGIVRAGVNNVVVKFAVYRPSDAACCPSLPAVRIHYSWNGSHLVETIPIPAGALEKNLTMRLGPAKA